MITDASDAHLLLRYADEHSEEAFAELVRRYIGLVYRAARRQLGADAHATEDVTQQVFTLLARKAAGLKRHTTLAAWLHTTTRYVASETLRAERRRHAREQEAYAMNQLLNDQAGEPEWERLRPVIDTTVAELNEPDREAVLLRFFAGLPLAQVGARLHVSENTARMRVERALERLHERLARRGVTSTSAALGLALAHQAAAGVVPTSLTSAVTSTALAGAAAAGGAGAWLGLWTFMSTNKVVNTAAIVAALLATGTAVYHISAERAAEARLASARQQHAALATRIAAAQREPATIQAEVATTERAVTERRRDAAPANGDSELAAGLLKANPELMPFLVRSRKAVIAGRYFGLYRELGLNEAQIARFEDIMISGASHTIAAVRDHGVDHGELRIEIAPELAPEEKQRQLTALLGDDGVRRMRAHQTTYASHVSRVASALYFTDTPLSLAQGRQLAELMTAQQSQVVLGTTAPAEYWNPILERARGFLSEPQLAAVAGLRARDELSWAQAQMTKEEVRRRTVVSDK